MLGRWLPTCSCLAGSWASARVLRRSSSRIQPASYSAFHPISMCLSRSHSAILLHLLACRVLLALVAVARSTMWFIGIAGRCGEESSQNSLRRCECFAKDLESVYTGLSQLGA